MTNRQPEPWESSAPGAFLTLERERGVVAIWALGADRFRVKAPEQEQVVVGFDSARETAHTLARQLDADVRDMAESSLAARNRAALPSAARTRPR